MEKELGKIESIRLGFGGYQDAMFGVSVTLSGPGWGVGDFRGTWATWTKGCQWTKKEQAESFAATMLYLRDLCQQAKVSDIKDLKGKPVEVCFENRTLKSWRLLKEVL